LNGFINFLVWRHQVLSKKSHLRLATSHRYRRKQLRR
jgi:hypothetical protein